MKTRATNIDAKGDAGVLVVGAGPTGLTLACELLRRGVGCRIIDKAPAPATTSRALGLQPRNLELFDRMGIIDEVLSTGGPVIDANLYDGHRLILTISAAGVRSLATPYPRLRITPQISVEAPLFSRLHALGGRVERGRELVGFADVGDGVISTVIRGDTGETEEMGARWLVGCDGSRSRVRKALGVPFEGDTYDEKFLLADVNLDWNRARDRTHTWFPPAGMFTVFPLPGTSRWRIFAVMEDGSAPPVSLELFRRLFRERTGDTTTTVSDPAWMSDFTINRRMAARYRVGRTFLAGDAAHVHSPFGAQGMNTGIQDAYNLAWKLALVLAGKSPERLLDTYEEERFPVAKRVLSQTDANTRILLSDNPLMRFVRERVITLKPVQDFIARRSSQLSVNYRASSLSRSYHEPPPKMLPPRLGQVAGIGGWIPFRSGLRPGDRAPDGPAVSAASGEETSLFRELRGTRFGLLLFGGTTRAEAGYANLATTARRVEERLPDDIQAHLLVAADEVPEGLEQNGSVLLDGSGTLHGLYGVRAEALYLVRPDGYVGLRGRPAREDKLVEYLDRLFTPALRLSAARATSLASTAGLPNRRAGSVK
jgi:2-polyprenyl-6-methoxyphenol hydroxylase-like FAD-dependent oxidoreductase